MPATLRSCCTSSRAVFGVSTSSAMISLSGIWFLSFSKKDFSRKDAKAQRNRKAPDSPLRLLCAFASLREKSSSRVYPFFHLTADSGIEVCESFTFEDLCETFVDLLRDAWSLVNEAGV